MRKSLLASVCALSLLAAVPALAATNGNSDNTTGSSIDNGAAPNTHARVQHNRAAMRSSSQTDTSQNGEVDRLNQQSLQAAQQGRAFMGSGASGMNSGLSSPGGSMDGVSGPGPAAATGPTTQYPSGVTANTGQPGQPQHFQSDAASGSPNSGEVTSYGSPNSYRGGRTATQGQPDTGSR